MGPFTDGAAGPGERAAEGGGPYTVFYRKTDP